MTRVAALALLLACPAHAAVRFALVAGANVGAEGDRALRWAEADATRVHRLFIELGGVDAHRATLLAGATARALELAVARLSGEVAEARRRGERTEVFVYYSGHGDGATLHLSDERLPRKRLEEWLEAVPADAVLTFIDACRTGAVRSGAARGMQHAPAFDVRFARQAGPSGRVLIESAGADEVAQESDDLEGGFFTHQLLTGLRGAADADRDRQVSVAEAYRYAYHRTLSASFGTADAAQHPSMSADFEGEGELVVTALNRAGATLELLGDVKGDVLVVDDATSRVIAELKASGDAPLQLALPVGDYRVIRRDGARIWAGKVTLLWSRTQAVSAASLAEQPRLAALQRGSRFDPAPWRLWAQGLVAQPRALGGGVSAGGRLGVDLRIDGPLFLSLRAGGGTAQARGEVWDARHSEFTLGPAAGLAFSFGAFRAAVMVAVELVALYASARHVQEDRLQQAGLGPTRTEGWTLGPSLGAEAWLGLPLPKGFELRAGAGLAVSWLKVDAQVRPSLVPAGHLGVAYAL